MCKPKTGGNYESKNIRLALEKQKMHFTDLQKIELTLRYNPELCKQLNEKCQIENILQTIVEARMSFYDNEISRRENMIDNAEIQEEYDERE